MMVTFISQCEKNALKKTRRVLDAFANRIGDNTWQTVITNEGLSAVKKLLRKTATKNTAVSCHWIRTRARSELVWVVGSKSKFDFQGIVPVNITEKEVPMDIQKNKPIKGVIYANTHLQRLDHHLFAVGYAAEFLHRKFYNENKKNLAEASFIAGCFHDIGKLDPSFQSWVVKPKNKSYQVEDGQHIDEAKFSFEKYPRHNEISALIIQCLSDQCKVVNKRCKKAIKHAVYWHHAKPFRPKSKSDFDTYGKIYSKLKSHLKDGAWSLITEKSLAMLANVVELDRKYKEEESSCLTKAFKQDIDDEVLENYDDTPLPNYKDYKQYEGVSEYENKTRENAEFNEVRSCVITADRWISSLSANELSMHIKQKTLDSFITDKLNNDVFVESDLETHINECIGNFPDSERSQKQSKVAKQLANDSEHVKVLAGAAGCGKTKIALEWAGIRGAQQIIWVCPRVQICQGMFTELKASEEPYLTNATVEIFTGEYKYTNDFSTQTSEDQYLTADIVVTTIDQLLSSVISHTKADRLLNYLSAHVVFDEYHEYINMPAFNLLFAELIASRKSLNNGCNALLVSATPHPYYVKNLLGIDTDCDVIEMASFNDSDYQFNFVTYDESKEDETNPLYALNNETAFIISNTATTAQKSFINNLQDENAILLHSKYKKSDKKSLFNKVFESFKREGNHEFDLLRSGPIVQASLNISCNAMTSEVTTPENCLQRMGRLDRFGENNSINQYTIAVPETFNKGKGSGAVARFLSRSHGFCSAKAWNELLIDKTDNGQTVQKIPDLYQLYKSFYAQDSSAIKFIEQDMLASLKQSVGVITHKVSEPSTIVTRKKQVKERAKISAKSLRGDSRFVQLAVCKLDNKNSPEFIEKYAYAVPTLEREQVDNLTASCDVIQGYGDSNNNLLTHMMKKHHNIMGEKKAFKDFILLNDAKDPEFPVYLSYTPNDLLAVGGESARHRSAIYYGECEKQAIGSISINNLTQKKD
ncbi:CRISPR-associated endonuclease Cas3'' [Psychrobium sp. nBUS_13]|uniref:CRISPR-associated endonuclease Cas3'' n=1 Tax=Psychrobium sp. nBUS_13 TaxID=3395319 RepID=UPI003EBA3F76